MELLRIRSSAGITPSSDDLHPIIQVVTWLLLSLTTLMLCFRFWTRYFLKSVRNFGLEDLFMILAFVFGVCQTVTVLLPQASSFGKHLNKISRDDLEASQKAQYAGDILFIVSLCFAKISVCATWLALCPAERHRRASYIIAGFVILWAISSIVGIAFQCGTHGSWVRNTSHCFHRLAFMRYTAIVNAMTDVALMLLPLWVVLPLNMPLKARLNIIFFFSSRMLVIAPILVQIVYLPRLYGPDFTWRASPYFITVQFVQFASISSACLTCFWPFMRSLRSGLMWTNKTTSSAQYSLSQPSSTSKALRSATLGNNVANMSAETDRSKEVIEVTKENTVSSERVETKYHTRGDSATHSYLEQW